MKRYLLLIFGISLIVSGCASVSVSHVGRSLVDIENTGWYLFNAIPIASGDPSHPNRLTCKFFTETVTLENNFQILNSVVKEHNATGVINPVSYKTDENVLFVLFQRHVYHTSAELVYSPTAATNEK